MVEDAEQDYGPWNPGIESSIPGEIMPLSTMFRSENVETSYAEAKELADFSGLPRFDVVRFRSERLVTHEILVRVTADLSVRDGPNYEDLGISLRGMVQRLVDVHAKRYLPEIETLHQEFCEETEIFIKKALGPLYSGETKNTKKPQSLWERLFKQKKPPKRTHKISDADRVATFSHRLEGEIKEASDEFHIAALSAILRVLNAFFATHGRLTGGETLIVSLATTIVANTHGSQLIGEFLDRVLPDAFEAEGYSVLPYQEKPVVMNVKGASASGKSTMRPLQRKLAEKLGIPWHDFALISPDYWRKYLLDYDALGEHYKYAGMLTGHELAIIDKKLDRHMAKKARAGRITHLLIDRFRFDSFSIDENRQGEGRLLTRFGNRVFLFFMVTPPQATVERAWYRGHDTGRYKAVEDLLYHNIEAYTGMPSLFFSWVLNEDRDIHFEFLDNAVPKGERPRTIAFGSNGEINIVDVTALGNIDRFRQVNIEAKCPDEVLQNPAPDDTPKVYEFLRNCIEKLNIVRFVNSQTGFAYLVIKGGKITYENGKTRPLATEEDIKSLIKEVCGQTGQVKMVQPSEIVSTQFVVGA